ncbi:NAD-dependent epimerase/dehydratase [Vibrio nigripulchritudo ATCC 27043]|uniref:GDP-mannose 4,6-dehydratase n=1 Tax=Vibrio nigripulchritudo TaxID=28173 RepID=UPI00021C1897|nr:GDP-mannose 4,6-dehydratase [Vibrio nigripulchritudo]EGU56685.1 NAD-dependent epimerase/dehydratase [Vibrio nigripulchritudo ATCC 27043]
MRKYAVIFGASGQDGFFLSKLLKGKGYFVHGVSRTDSNCDNSYVDKWSSWDYWCETQLYEFLDWSKIDEIYILAGQSSVGHSFNEPSKTLFSFVVPLTMILDGIRNMNVKIRLYNACSSEVFGNTSLDGVSEESDMSPVSPYGVAKKMTSDLVKLYRKVYDLYCVNGYLFNHESNIRPDKFFSKKLVNAAKDIRSGNSSKVKLGCLDNIRDWGWAEDYVVPMHLMLNQDAPEDYIISTGEGHSLQELAEGIFDFFDLDLKDYYELNSSFVRKDDIKISVGNPSKALVNLNWKSKYKFKDIIRKLASENEI